MKLLGISGSLRKFSFNSALLAAAVDLLPQGCFLEIATIRDIPLYDADVEESSGIPAAVDLLKNRIAACDGLLLATPEYNNSIPGVFKNAIDWTTRPPADIGRVYGKKPVAVIGASPGGFGTILSQNAWLPVLRTLGTQHWNGGRLLVSGASKLIQSGELVDEATRERLRTFLVGFSDFVRVARQG